MTASLRSAVKRVAERGLVAARLPNLIWTLSSESAVILTYHNVVPDGESAGGDRSLHLPREDFARHLDLLVESHGVVSLETLLRGTASNGRPQAAITFDDAYRGALTAGVGELTERGLPFSVFVPPGLLGSSSVWWDALATPEEGRVPPEVREAALVRARGRDDDVRRWAEQRGLTLAPQPRHASLVDEDLLDEVLELAGGAVGAHGWSHANLVELGDAELDEEVRRPLTWLRERFADCVVPWLSLPYGHSSRRVTAAALDAGYEGVLTLEGRRVRPGRSPREVPRVTVPAGVSPEGFLLRTAGL